jgi:hypothetical protein
VQLSISPSTRIAPIDTPPTKKMSSFTFNKIANSFNQIALFFTFSIRRIN